MEIEFDTDVSPPIDAVKSLINDKISFMNQSEDDSLDGTESLSLSSRSSTSSSNNSLAPSSSPHPTILTEHDAKEDHTQALEESVVILERHDNGECIEMHLQYQDSSPCNHFHMSSNPNECATADTIEKSTVETESDCTSAGFGQTRLVTKARVRFNLDLNVYHLSNVFDMTEEEVESCWYSRESKDEFKGQSILSAREVFLKKRSFLFAWFEPLTPEFNEFADGILDAFDACSEPEVGMRVCERENFNNSMICETDYLFTTRTAGVRADQPQRSPDAYRATLFNMYLTCDDLPGLEHFILTPFRGEPESLRKLVLNQALLGSHMNAVSREQNDPIHGIEQDQSGRQNYQLPYDKNLITAMAFASQSISRPSRRLAHEFAKALADALSQQEENDQ